MRTELQSEENKEYIHGHPQGMKNITDVFGRISTQGLKLNFLFVLIEYVILNKMVGGVLFHRYPFLKHAIPSALYVVEFAADKGISKWVHYDFESFLVLLVDEISQMVLNLVYE